MSSRDVKLAALLLTVKAEEMLKSISKAYENGEDTSLADVFCGSLWMGVEMASNTLGLVAIGDIDPVEACTIVSNTVSRHGYQAEIIEVEGRG